jgi:Tfp pilus assembly ATPase PilU
VYRAAAIGVWPVLKQLRACGHGLIGVWALFAAGRISYEDALRNADSVNDLQLSIKLNGKDAKDRDPSAGTGHLGLV